MSIKNISGVIIFFLVFLSTKSLMSQTVFSVTTKYGLPTAQSNFFNPKKNTFQGSSQSFDVINTLWDSEFSLNVSYTVLKKYNLNLDAGVNYGITKYSFPIYNHGIKPTRLADISFTNDRIMPHVGVSKKFYFYDKKVSLDLGTEIRTNYYVQSEKKYEAVDQPTESDYKTYDYKLILYNRGYFTNDQNVRKRYLYSSFYSSLNLNIGKNIDLKFMLSLRRNQSVFYGYKKRITTITGSSYTSVSTGNIGLVDYGNGPVETTWHNAKVDHFIYFGVGINLFPWGRN